MSVLKRHGTPFKDDYFQDSQDLAEGFKDDNPLGNSDNYEVYMSDVAKQQDVVEFAEQLDGVRKVNKSDVVAKTLTSVNRLIGYVSIAIIGILLAVSIFLISNTVTMGITVRREEIAIMKYIGAKDWVCPGALCDRRFGHRYYRRDDPTGTAVFHVR